MQIDTQNNDLSNAKLHDTSIGVHNDHAKIENQNNAFIFKNKEIDQIKTDFFDVRKKIIIFVSKLIITIIFLFTLITFIGMRFYRLDSFNLFVSFAQSLGVSFAYFFFNKFYYKEYRIKNSGISDSEKFTVLAIVDMVFLGLLFLSFEV